MGHITAVTYEETPAASYQRSTATLEVTQAMPPGLSEEPTEWLTQRRRAHTTMMPSFDNPARIETQGNWVYHSTRALAGTPNTNFDHDS